MNSEAIATVLKTYHRSFSSQSALFDRQSYFESFRDCDALNVMQLITEETLCAMLSQEISCLRSSSFILQGRVKCTLFQPSSFKVPYIKAQSSRLKLLDVARNTTWLHECTPFFVGVDVMSICSNKQAAILCYRLPSTDLRDSFSHLLSHPIFGTRDKTARIRLECSARILWITILWTGDTLPLGVDVLKLAHHNTPACKISSPLNSISTISSAKPQEFQLSPSEQSPSSQGSWGSCLGRIHEDLDALQAELLLRFDDNECRHLVYRE